MAVRLRVVESKVAGKRRAAGWQGSPKKVFVPDPESVPTAIIFYFNHPLPATLLFSHQAHPSIAYLMPPIDPIENP
jgi:hypothetical protein